MIVGQNNVGKTALVDTLSLQFGNNPHRSLETVPARMVVPEPTSSVDISFALDRDELEELLVSNLPTFTIPAHPSVDPNIEEAQFLKSLWNHDVSVIRTYFEAGQIVSGYLSAYGGRGAAASHLILTIDPSDRSLASLHLDNSATPIEDFARGLAALLIPRIYRFKEVRFNIEAALPSSEPHLASDVSNLAQVLHLLQSNPSRFRRFNDLVSTVFPQIKQITVPPVPGTNTVRILVWSIDPGTERDDLAVPLSESGTGIGQVLAILYVVLTSEYPRTIIIDEPQSFLHPGAVRKLFDILKQYPQHQYIITTHSPTAITAADPQTLLLVRKEGAESLIDTVDIAETQELRRSLSEVGARLSDVFGADNVLWVEGRTEELCFPLILSRLVSRPLLGTAIVGVVQTGDFESKHSSTILEIYRRLSEARGLLPPAIGFIFDQEERTQEEREDLIRQSGQSNVPVNFTTRRMYENYLLNPNGIAAVASNIDGFRDRSAITPAKIEEWIRHNGGNNKYFGRRRVGGVSWPDEAWLRNVRGAKLLEDMFDELSEGRTTYNKVEHGVKLTEWLIDNARDELAEVSELLRSVLPENGILQEP